MKRKKAIAISCTVIVILFSVGINIWIFYKRVLSTSDPIDFDYKLDLCQEISDSNDLSTSCPSRIYVLDKPFRRFHSNHWFHLGEYYLSHFVEVNNRSQNFFCNTSLDVFILVNSHYFINYMTHMSTFLLSLTFSDDFTRNLYIVYTPLLDDRINANNSSDNILINFTIDTTIKSYSYSSKTPNLAEKFHVYNPILQETPPGCNATGVYINTYGSNPIASNLWFSTHTNATPIIVRDKIKKICSFDHKTQYSNIDSIIPYVHHSFESLSTLRKSDKIMIYTNVNTTDITIHKNINNKPFKMVFYQRDKNRRFINLLHVLETLHKNFDLGKSWQMKIIVHDETMNPCIIYHHLANADLFVTAHGFQSTALLFLKPGAVLFEVFPYKYFKPSYLLLSLQYGVHHRWTQSLRPTSFNRLYLKLLSQNMCMKYNKCRSHARGDSIELTDTDISRIAEAAKDVQMGKLGVHNAPY